LSGSNGREHGLVVGDAQHPETVGELERDGQVTARVAGLQRTDDQTVAGLAARPLADLDVRPVAVELQVAALQRQELQRLSAPPAAFTQKLRELLGMVDGPRKENRARIRSAVPHLPKVVDDGLVALRKKEPLVEVLDRSPVLDSLRSPLPNRGPRRRGADN
jgi:hypothetical protein